MTLNGGHFGIFKEMGWDFIFFFFKKKTFKSAIRELPPHPYILHLFPSLFLPFDPSLSLLRAQNGKGHFASLACSVQHISKQWDQRVPKWLGPSQRGPRHCVGAWLSTCGSYVFLVLEQRSTTTFSGCSWYHYTHLVLPFLPVSSVFWRKWPEGWHTFLCNQRFAIRFEPNITLFWGNDLEFILLTKKYFPMKYNLSMFGAIEKRHFSRQTVKIVI